MDFTLDHHDFVHLGEQRLVHAAVAGRLRKVFLRSDGGVEEFGVS
jgi:hypothetical protein